MRENFTEAGSFTADQIRDMKLLEKEHLLNKKVRSSSAQGFLEK